jgi:hypothetical protein
MDPYDIDSLINETIKIRASMLTLLLKRFTDQSIVKDIETNKSYKIDLSSPDSIIIGQRFDGEYIVKIKCESPYSQISYINYLSLSTVCMGGIIKKNFYKQNNDENERSNNINKNCKKSNY